MLITKSSRFLGHNGLSIAVPRGGGQSLGLCFAVQVGCQIQIWSRSNDSLG